MIKIKQFLCITFLFLTNNSFANKKRIAIVSLHDSAYEPVGKYAHLNKADYAKRHNYKCFLYTDSLDTSRKTQWSKIIAIQKHLNDFNWIFWTDADALVMNKNIKLESLIDERFDIIITKDYNHINTGNFLIKNSDWSKEFLKLLYNPVYLQSNIGQQSKPEWLNDNWAFIRLYDDLPHLRKRIKIIPQRKMNSYSCKSPGKIDALYQKGDFILHIVGCCSLGVEKKAIEMKEWYDKSI